MTTIAYRDGVIAADTGMTLGESRVGHMSKIARNADGDLAGVAGRATYGAAFLAWVTGGTLGEPPKAEADQNSCDRGLLARADGRVEIFEQGGSFVVQAPYVAIGSGRPEALGAMFAGADAQMAVRAAMEHDGGTYGDVQVLERASRQP